ncbi:MAG: methyltransferase domain-containing protein [Chloroflexi bacterium]|nr:methyltransferase domain-containing protein [Chloroflexota bacterium]
MDLIEKIRKWKQGTEYLNWGRDIVAAMAKQQTKRISSGDLIRVLDVGFGGGSDLLNVKNALLGRDAVLYGIDSDSARVAQAFASGIVGVELDIERARFPFDDCFFDIVIANQVLEHAKEIFWILSEISRVLKPAGILIAGVPNLAALHNRMLLAVGEQPTCIDLLGPHVRGFTKSGFARFVGAENYFRVLEVKGANFYPFPAQVAQWLSRRLPTLSVGLFFLCLRTDKEGTFIQVLKNRSLETDFFSGAAV